MSDKQKDSEKSVPPPEPKGPSIPTCDRCGRPFTQCKCTHNELMK